MFKLIYTIFLFLILPISHSFAYLGPGIGMGPILATLGIIFAIFAALFGLIWFPLKKLFKKKIKKPNNKK